LGREGASLIEILVAMLVLAVGLLGLEALGIHAARVIALADRTSGYATVASNSLDAALHELGRQVVPAQFCRADLPHGDRLSRTVDLSTPGVATVLVRVIPNPDSSNAPREPYEISASLFLGTPLAGAASGAPCG
jgi:hypothetical protein